MPDVRPFRALRYAVDPADFARVIAPPYDVVGAEAAAALLARDPRNVIRLDAPAQVSGEDPDERYRRASRLLAAWRGDGTLRQDPRPSVYVYEQEYALPGDRGPRRTRAGFFARVRLEPFGPGSSVRRHEQTLSGPKEDRYRLLRATGVNTSPVVAMYEDGSGQAGAMLDAIRATTPTAEAQDDRGERHRLWVISASDSAAEALCRLAGAGPITIADGHHRYETALRYRDERRIGAPPDDDPAYDHVLMLLLEPRAGRIDVLATHRIVLGLGSTGLDRLRDGLRSEFDVAPVGSAAALTEAFAAGSGEGGLGRFGFWTRDGGAILMTRSGGRAGTSAVERLDVTILAGALERLAGIDAAAVAGGQRLAYSHDAAEAISMVDRSEGGADAAFLLHGTPADRIAAVAADGDVMPQKSTYIYPKAATGLVINPLES